MPNFDDAGVNAVFDAVVSQALASGYFDQVNVHEPKAAPHNGITAAVWIEYFGPAISSGLAATSAILRLNVRIYTKMQSEPEDMIDPNMVAACSALMGKYSGNFDLDVANVRCIDLLGMAGVPLQAQAGYVELDRKIYRIMTITLPIILNDAWAQVP